LMLGRILKQLELIPIPLEEIIPEQVKSHR